MVSPTTLVQIYDAGEMTRHELLIRLCQAAVDQPPGPIAAALPPDLLTELREWAMTAPESPTQSRVFWMGAGEEDVRRESQRFFDGRCRWRRYFTNPNESNQPGESSGGSALK